jgi:hypothetical protein
MDITLAFQVCQYFQHCTVSLSSYLVPVNFGHIPHIVMTRRDGYNDQSFLMGVASLPFAILFG